ncbi:acyl-CoA dehydrogenase family protein [Corynebacterium anserum]|uniref:Acyl-[acyl-carrier-protein] dehydrogenase MbtN n=1 Tax=Corynebacterium anserum TaxID=2684406 RepID=A0A7G7YQC5_9CORY|nr:acyl-CoA dehydrogenase family protein [Corynebacterium anserum]QNH96695.1 acyl-CoA dehydrogenase [Corynebacterium anserum]
MSQLDDYTSPWMNDELKALRELARDFFERESVPNQERFAKNKQVDRDFWNKAGEQGLLCLSMPEEYGGGGGTFAHDAVVLEEQAYVFDSSFGNHVHSVITAPYFNHYGTEEQKKYYLPKLASGEMVAAIAMTEPGTGSDLQGVKTTAVADGDEWVINGSKTFITNGTHADVIVVVCRTGGVDVPGHQALSLIIVETKDLTGFERGRILDKVGQKGQDTRELFFDDVRVPKANLLGGEGRGFYQLMEQLPQERLSVAVAAVANAEAALKETITYVKQRKAFGKTIFDFQNTRFELAECMTDIMAVRTYIDYCIQQHVDGKLTAAGASGAKYLATDKQCEVIDRCLQLHGGYGYMLEYPIGRAYQDARVMRIYAGTNEIMKELIARSL